MSDYKLTEQSLLEEYNKAKQLARSLRNEVVELRKFKHSVDYLLHPIVEEAWLAGYNSEFPSFTAWRDYVRDARKEEAYNAKKRNR